MRNIFYLLSCMVMAACNPFKVSPDVTPSKVWGYVPVYSKDVAALKIYADSAFPVFNAGKIYVKEHLIFQNDCGFGIHVIDNSVPTNAKRIGFIHLPGNLEISIRGNFLYANSYADLVVLDISSWQHPKEIQRIKNAFQEGNRAYDEQEVHNNGNLYIPLPEKRVYYECIDPNKGYLVGWKKDSVYNNACFFNN